MTVHGEIDHRSFRHWGGFIFSGLTAFVVDFAVTETMSRYLGLEANIANLIGILCATVVAWLMHRRISFNVPDPPSWREFGRFFVVASGANAASWLSDALFLWLIPVLHLDAVLRPMIPVSTLEIAFVTSRTVGGALSYIGFRFAVFRRKKVPASAG